MIDSFRALSSFSLAPSLYGLIRETCSISHYPHPSLPFSTLSLHTSVAFPCVYSSFPWKRRLSLPPRPATSPSSHHHASPHLSLHSSIYLSHPSLSLFFCSLSLLLSSLLPSHSFLSVWDFFRKMCLLSAFLQSLPLFILVLLSPLLHSFFDLSFPC